MIQTVTIYAASSQKVPEKYLLAAAETARVLASQQIRVIYGGGSLGLMGRLADTMLALGGQITGIIPRFMIEAEWAHPGLDELKVVETMHERKQAFLEGTDAVIALPGGTGTLEELLETLTLKRLGLFTRPVLIMNTDGFYDPLFSLLDQMIEERFLRPEHRNMWTVVENPAGLMEGLRSAPAWDSSAIGFAAV